MSSRFEDLREGLQEAIDFEKGTGKAKTTVFLIAPVTKYSNEQIKSIRNKSGMTQAVFANYMGVSKKTVEAWELGRTYPTDPACRLLDILDQDKEGELSFVTIKSHYIPP
ncbi:MAG: helix-turn-helix domain-containing protein [Lachnospiraceae bacterium]|nr:helix-turn-helix domain-containing protein [Lachnospiraceae bacterium]